MSNFHSDKFIVNFFVFLQTNRSFGIDFENDQFLKDGKPFRYISGSFHYFRAMPDTWSRKLRTLRAAGLNAVSTYVEWSLHNPHDGIYKWDGIADLIKFIQLAAEEDLLVLLRPGPYVCAERDMVCLVLHANCIECCTFIQNLYF